ncbi:MAG: penicillin-insensitive murein endopeptidase [Planctomycetes bacterium]|nr:penicillin-insensitive murein endopeptidase [Planctomycetota bacterium]
MKIHREGFALSAALAAIIAGASAAPALDAEKITASSLNVRSAPSTSASIVGEIPYGQSYVPIAASGSWRKIWFNSGTAWVYGSYLSPAGVAEGQVTAGSLNVRSGPGTGYSVVGSAPAGSWWAIVGTSGAWRKIYFGGAARWVHGAYLSTGGLSSGDGGGGSAPTSGLPTSSVGFVQLPASGTGFYCYSVPDRRWGKPSMVYKLMEAAGTWKSGHPAWPRIGVGDISLPHGGPISGHVSHQHGVDADLRLVRTSGESAVTIYEAAYSRPRTLDWITNHVHAKLNVSVIFFNDPEVYHALSYVQYWPNHHNHMHVRIH